MEDRWREREVGKNEHLRWQSVFIACRDLSLYKIKLQLHIGLLMDLASGDKTMKLWDEARGTNRSTLKGHPDGEEAAVFFPTGALVAFASFNWIVRF